MKLEHCALWNQSNVEVSYTPLHRNVGGTSLMGTDGRRGEGAIKMRTRMITDFIPIREVRAYCIAGFGAPTDNRDPFPTQFFFMKIDVENSEEMVLKPMEAMIADRKIRHFVMEVRSNQAAFVGWIVRVGYMCSIRGTPFWKSEAEAIAAVAATLTDDDIYCTAPRARIGRRLSREMPHREFSGHMTAAGWV